METIRLPFITMHDEYAWLENTASPISQSAYIAENNRFFQKVNDPKMQKRIDAWITANKIATKDFSNTLPTGIQLGDGITVEIQELGSNFNAITIYSDERVIFEAENVCSFIHTYAEDPWFGFILITDEKYLGSEHLQATAYRIIKGKETRGTTVHYCLRHWIINDVGKNGFIHDSQLIIQKTPTGQPQRYYSIVTIQLSTGHQNEVIVTTSSLNQIVSPVFVYKNTLIYQQGGARWKSIRSIALRKAKNILPKILVAETKDPISCFHSTNGDKFFWYDNSSIYDLQGTTVFTIRDKNILSARSYKDGFLIKLIDNLIVSLIFVEMDGTVIPVFQPNSSGIIILHSTSDKTTIEWKSPDNLPIFYEIGAKFVLKKIGIRHLTVKLESAYTLLRRDDKLIPATLVKAKGNQKPRGLLVYVYGHYGHVTPTQLTKRWYTWLIRGYVVAYVGVRGSGDNGTTYWDAGRSVNRIQGFLDLAAAIPQIQKMYDLSSAKTIVYGRSAGGTHVANAANFLDTIIGGAWAEAPYVDVIKGCVNPKIPVQPLEMDEYYDCQDWSQFHAALQIDPMVHIKPKKEVFVLATGGLQDSEVMPWEPIKWVRRLRDNGWKNVYCRVDSEVGHFQVGEETDNLNCQEAALLESGVGINA